MLIELWTSPGTDDSSGLVFLRIVTFPDLRRGS